MENTVPDDQAASLTGMENTVPDDQAASLTGMENTVPDDQAATARRILRQTEEFVISRAAAREALVRSAPPSYERDGGLRLATQFRREALKIFRRTGPINLDDAEGAGKSLLVRQILAARRLTKMALRPAVNSNSTPALSLEALLEDYYRELMSHHPSPYPRERPVIIYFSPELDRVGEAHAQRKREMEYERKRQEKQDYIEEFYFQFAQVRSQSTFCQNLHNILEENVLSSALSWKGEGTDILIVHDEECLKLLWDRGYFGHIPAGKDDPKVEEEINLESFAELLTEKGFEGLGKGNPPKEYRHSSGQFGQNMVIDF